MPNNMLSVNFPPEESVLYRRSNSPIFMYNLRCFLPMVWVLEKKVFYHILDMGFESVGIPVRVKFEFDVRYGKLVPDSLSYESLYNQQAVVSRYPGLKKDLLEKEIQQTIKREIRKYLQNCGYVPDND
jgi:hypothetical protein